jgi:hypothetical protein
METVKTAPNKMAWIAVHRERETGCPPNCLIAPMGYRIEESKWNE